MKIPELLAPAGDINKMKYALAYGADAVYMGLDKFNLREKSQNFDLQQFADAVEYVKEKNKKIYLTLNIIAKNNDVEDIKQLLPYIQEIQPHAVIVADIGLINLVTKYAPSVDVHVSTQANITNSESAKTFCRLGAKRLILARELSLSEVKQIKQAIGKENEVEIFVHGAMCISYSGRCLLSSYMAGRDANAGDCAQSCRWKYALMEQKRPDEYYPIYEDDYGSYILNSKDLNLVNNLPEILQAGVDSIKIEGRMKSILYVSSVVKAYRSALDDLKNSKSLYSENLDKYNMFVNMASHRPYTTAYNLEDNNNYLQQTQQSMSYKSGAYHNSHIYCGLIEDYDSTTKLAKVFETNPVHLDDEIHIMSPSGELRTQIVEKLYNEDMQSIENAHHPAMTYYLKTDFKPEPYSIIIKNKAKEEV